MLFPQKQRASGFPREMRRERSEPVVSAETTRIQAPPSCRGWMPAVCINAAAATANIRGSRQTTHFLSVMVYSSMTV